MKNQFVTYEIALKLKELGFDELCLAYFRNDKYQDLICTCENVMDGNFIVNHYSGDINAPLWQQAIDFMWEKYHILINAYQIPEGDVIWQVLYEFCPTKEQAILKAIELC